MPSYAVPTEKRVGWLSGLALCIAVVTSGCDRPEATELTPPPKEVVIDFPATLEVNDPSVNQAVQDLLNACAEGDFDTFRQLWSNRKQPLSRKEFERGWQAMTSIHVKRIEPFRTEVEGPVRYFVRAVAKFDETLDQRRRVAELVLHRVGDQWEWIPAPEGLAERLGSVIDLSATSVSPENTSDPIEPASTGNHSSDSS